jgi:hypothetical protein
VASTVSAIRLTTTPRSPSTLFTLFHSCARQNGAAASKQKKTKKLTVPFIFQEWYSGHPKQMQPASGMRSKSYKTLKQWKDNNPGKDPQNNPEMKLLQQNIAAFNKKVLDDAPLKRRQKQQRRDLATPPASRILPLNFFKPSEKN